MGLRPAAVVAFFIAAAGSCSDPASAPATQATGNVAALRVTIEVTGDVDAVPMTFPVAIDGRAMSFASNSTALLSVTAGDHVVELKPLANPSGATQCVLAGEARRTVAADPARIAEITFAVKCNRLTGNGGIQVTVTTSGTFTPSYVTVTIASAAGVIPVVQIADQMPSGSTRFYAVEAGTYVVGAKGPSCGAFIDPSTKTAIVTDGATVTLKFALLCIP